MLIVGTANTAPGLVDGMAALRDGASATDAVEVALRAVESNPEDDSVGLGGLPNLLGQVELDASIMEGTGLRAGAVGALAGFLHPISVARKVMELLPHVLLVGEGAARFARETGAETGELLTEASLTKYRERLGASGVLAAVETDDPEVPLYRLLQQHMHYRPGGTANVIARDREGRLACGVTTSGWAFKYPGRLGDSPIIGAGGYADDRYGAAACTGLGEVALRLCTAHSLVRSLAAGQSADEACAAALQEAQELPLGMPFVLNILALDAQGRQAFWSTKGPEARYLSLGPEEDQPQSLPASGLPTAG